MQFAKSAGRAPPSATLEPMGLTNHDDRLATIAELQREGPVQSTWPCQHWSPLSLISNTGLQQAANVTVQRRCSMYCDTMRHPHSAPRTVEGLSNQLHDTILACAVPLHSPPRALMQGLSSRGLCDAIGIIVHAIRGCMYWSVLVCTAENGLYDVGQLPPTQQQPQANPS